MAHCSPTVEPHPPAAGSLTVLTLADPDAPAQTAPGRYVLAHMPPSAQAVRLAGDALKASGLADETWRGRHRGQLVACDLAENIRASATIATMNDLHRPADAAVRPKRGVA